MVSWASRLYVRVAREGGDEMEFAGWESYLDER
jgi:hypothetical protein